MYQIKVSTRQSNRKTIKKVTLSNLVTTIDEAEQIILTKIGEQYASMMKRFGLCTYDVVKNPNTYTVLYEPALIFAPTLLQIFTIVKI